MAAVRYTLITRCSRCGKFCREYWEYGKFWSECCDWPSYEASHAIIGRVKIYNPTTSSVRPAKERR